MIVTRWLRTRRWFFFSSRRRHTRCSRDWSSDVCSSDLLFTPESRTGDVEAAHLAERQAFRSGKVEADSMVIDHFAGRFWGEVKPGPRWMWRDRKSVV